MMKHTPVYLEEVLEALNVEEGKRYIDATAGQLGHLNNISELKGTVLGIEYDKAQFEASQQLISDKRTVLALGNFSNIEEIAKSHDFTQVDGVLFDFGISFGQLAGGSKGLSYKNLDEDLDMRLGEDAQETAASFLKSASKEELYEVFARYGEEPNSEKIARAVVASRSQREIKTVGDLREVIDRAVENVDSSVYGRIFQALRMHINDEVENIKKGFGGALNIVKKGGVIVTITFNSGEDRLIKQLIAKNKTEIEKDWKVKKKMPKQFERSALMRVVVRK